MFVYGTPCAAELELLFSWAPRVLQAGSESQVEWDEAAAEAAAEAEWEAEADWAEALEEECADAEEEDAEEAAAAEDAADADAGAAAAADAAPAPVQSPQWASEPQHRSACEHGLPFGMCHNCRAGGTAGSDAQDIVPPVRLRMSDDLW